MRLRPLIVGLLVWLLGTAAWSDGNPLLPILEHEGLIEEVRSERTAASEEQLSDLLYALARAGLTEDVARLVSQGEPGSISRLARDPEDRRIPQVAAALIVAGRGDAAEPLLAALAVGSSDPRARLMTKWREHLRGRAAVGELLRAAADPTGQDPFDLFVEVLVDRRYDDRQGLSLLLALENVARRHGYNDLGCRLGSRRLDLLDEWMTSEVLAKVRESRGTRLWISLERERVALEDRRSCDDPIPMATALVDQGLERPFPPVLHLRPLPPHVQPIEQLPWPQAEEEVEKQLKELPRPPRVEPIRVEHQEGVVVVIGHDLASPALRIARSRDGGSTWEWADLPKLEKVWIRMASALPVLNGDQVQIEVEVMNEEGDQELGSILTGSWSGLKHDSDEDGLSDVSEIYLLTDPATADTDLDGLGDAIDPLPHVPASPIPDRGRTALVEAMMEGWLPTAPTREPLPETRGVPTYVVLGDARLFRGARPSRRTLVLAPHQKKPYEERFRTMADRSVEILLVDPTSRRAAVRTLSYGGCLTSPTYDRFVRQDGAWREVENE